ncbi:ABC transporter substrate-binding protein [Paenibacillus sp. NFR01]|uniref:ABC transporter substrate-binding protein n=1 Tax=Paenibacillus sp. NFR01 TaxID=1566279 RepID=UPI0008B52CB2|nr:ABC transporter substrate-binding protein [Paenibacillus sp. NFR01]SEU20565.1 putative aldouronate transport system substrate-binding protein [Paenibacillus sp. NFR01]
MKTKKFLCLSLAMLLLSSLATACSSNNNGNTAGADTTAKPDATKSTNAGGEEVKKDKVTYTIFNGVAGSKDGNTNETTIGKMLEDQTGVNFKLEFLVGDLNTKIGTMIAANEYPDVLIPDAAIEEVLNAGAFIPLDDLIDKYGPNIKRVYGDDLDQMRSADGKLYFLPMSAQVGDFVPDPEPTAAFWVQRRVLEEAGYPKVKTLDQYMQLIENYAAKHKDEGLTGMVSLTHDWRFFATANPPMHLLGYPNDGNVMVDPTTLEAKTYSGSDAAKRWLQALNQLNSKGLFDKASFVDNYDQYIAKLTSHKVLGFFDYRWQVQNALNVLKDAARKDPSLDGYNYFPLPVTFDENTQDAYVDGPGGLVTNRGIGITVSAKHPERIIQYFDNMLKEENQILLSWGIKGETYEVNDQGRYYRTAEQINKIDEAFNEKFGFKYYSWNWPSYGGNSTLSDGNAKGVGYQPEVFQMSLTDKDKEILNKYGAQTYTQMFAKPIDRPWYPAWGFVKEQNSPELMWETNKDELTKKYYPKLVLASPGKFDSIWGDFEKEWNKLDTAGYEKWTTEQVKKKVNMGK